MACPILREPMKMATLGHSRDSCFQIGILLVTGVYQAKYLQKYFHKKKLV